MKKLCLNIPQLLALLLIFSVFPTISQAVEYNPEFIKYLEESLQKANDDVVFSLNGDDKRIAQRITISLNKTGSIFDAYTADDYTTYISLPFLAGVRLTSEASALTALKIAKGHFFESYLRYLVFFEEFQSFETPEDLMMQDEDCKSRLEQNTTSFENLSEIIFQESIRLIVAHEIGHHVSSHFKEKNKTQIEMEREADKWALETLLNMGHFPQCEMGHLMLMRNIELTCPKKKAVKQTHPTASKRIISLLEAVPEMVNNHRVSYNAVQNSTGLNADDVIRVVARNLEKIQTIVNLEEMKDEDNLIKRVKLGDFLALMDLINGWLYGDGQFRKNPERAGKSLIKQVGHIDSIERFDFCWVNHMLGVWFLEFYEGDSDFKKKACVRYFRDAAKLGYLPSIRKLNSLGEPIHIAVEIMKPESECDGFVGNWYHEKTGKLRYKIRIKNGKYKIYLPEMDGSNWSTKVVNIKNEANEITFTEVFKSKKSREKGGFSGFSVDVKLKLIERATGYIKRKTKGGNESVWESDTLVCGN